MAENVISNNVKFSTSGNLLVTAITNGFYYSLTPKPFESDSEVKKCGTGLEYKVTYQNCPKFTTVLTFITFLKLLIHFFKL